MDPSVGQPDDGTQSPTQVNEGRSYDRYAENPASLESLGIRHTQEQAGFGDNFLAENDSGAINFESLYSGGPEPEADADIEADSPMADESQFGKQRVNGMARFFPNPDNDPAATEPETPAAPKNPFAAFAGKFQTPLVTKSQLFAQTTPGTAGFGNQVSPTWSRPSPSDLPMHTAVTPYTGGSSVLRPRFPNSMPDDLQTPMPEPTFHNLETSSQSRPDAITPYPNRPAAPALQQFSSPIRHRRRATAPIKDYEPMKESQERRQASTGSRARLGSFDSNSDDDANTASQRRRNNMQKVQKKKQEASKKLSTISMSGPTFRNDIIEVPSSTRKDERPRSRGLRSSSQAPEECFKDPEDTPSESRPTTTEKPFDGPRSSVPESEYGHLSFPQSMIDAEYGTKSVPAHKTPTSSANYLPEVSVSDTVQQPPRHTVQPHSSINEAYAIPETSPTRIPASDTISRPIDVPSDAAETASFPPSADLNLISSQALLDLPSPARPQTNQHEKDKIDQVVGLLKQRVQQDRDAIDLATSSPPVPAPETISRKRRRRVDDDESASNSARPSRAASRATSRAVSVSSSRSAASALSSLSVTPTQVSHTSRRSRTGTPITANDSDRSTHLSDKKDGAAAASISGIDIIDIPDDSPLLPRRRRRDQMLPLPIAKQTVSASASAYMRRGPSPIPSGSTDELAVSPVSMTAGAERRTRSTRNFGRSTSYRGAALAPTSHRRESAAPGLFAGMLFSVSFQSKRKGESDADYSKREKQGEKLQAKITEGGGSMLPDGFDALFQPPQFAQSTSRYRSDADSTNRNSLRLLPGSETGFTALISDGHTRKAKYMQALALGLPCLAPRWITTCIERNELVDWSPYLLCAGESSYLGGAIRSRNLVSYDAHTAQLVDIVDARSKLLEGLDILVFLRRSSTREAYVFLAHVLGANLSRAHSLQDARDQLRAREDAGRPFDWVYTDEEANINDIFTSTDRASRPAAKRRKRASSAMSSLATHTDGERPPAAVKLLSDERFIQSLIFGKLIEEDDLGD